LKKIRLKRETTNYILVWIAILITAWANIITTSNITLVVVTFFVILIFFHRKEKIDKGFIYFTLVYFLILAIYIIKFDYVDFRGFREYLKLLYAYMFIKLVYKDFFRMYTSIVYKLALISLPLYVLQLIDYDMMKLVIGILEHNIPFLDYREDWYENLFFFTLIDSGSYRNSGFAWEPKGFGTFLILAFLFNLILKKFQFFDTKNIVYLLAMGTTLSTATYSLFLLTIIPFYLLNKKVSIKLFASMVSLPIIFITFTQLDFMQKKIIHEYETRDKYLNYVNDRGYDGISRSMGRFGGMILDYQDLQKEPLLGYGLYSEQRTMFSVEGVKLVRVNGFSDFSAKFGLIGLLFLIIGLLMSFKVISKQFKFKGYFMIPISILLMSFGSAILLRPIYLSLLLYFIINKRVGQKMK